MKKTLSSTVFLEMQALSTHPEKQCVDTVRDKVTIADDIIKR
jgi:hypothetical protein